MNPSPYNIFESNGEQSSVIFSKDRLYRYSLSWKTGIPGDKKLVWLMLNPSTADAFKLDPTLTRCLYRSCHHKANEMIIINLFAFRSPYPKDLYTVGDPIGKDNDYYIDKILSFYNTSLVCAWGSHALVKQRGHDVLMRNTSISKLCLGVTKDGQPKHPLHVAYSQDLIPFDI